MKYQYDNFIVGIFGMRPSHNRITLEHVLPLALSHDTVGW